jgi:hypothetical protein
MAISKIIEYMTLTHTNLEWLNNYEHDVTKSNEWNYFIDLKFRISEYISYCNDIDKLINLFEINTMKMPGVGSRELVIHNIIFHCLKYKPWNQYYYNNLNTETLYKIIELGLKKYQIKKKIDDISEDFI